ncbi:MAG: MFS transporter [Anaerolineaceae bacterium]|nr:MFS transporter [Anaerolineaceae bacterium]
MEAHNPKYKWYILALVVLTNMFIMAMPMMGLSVMSKEISEDLNLTLVQVGIVWGAGSLPGIVSALLGGMIGDKLGPKRVLVVGTLVGGLIAMSRGFAGSFMSLVVLQVLMGMVVPMALMNGIKTLGQWFPKRQLGLANGVQSMGMALGFMIGSLFSATTFSPLLGGWRNVLIVYGLLGALLSIPWFFTKSVAVQTHAAGKALSLRSALQHVISLKAVWLLGIALFGMSGAVQGSLGYLPLYLRGLGWEAGQADGVLSAFHTVSMAFVLPIALLSDRLRVRKPFLLIASLIIAAGFGLLSFVNGGAVWAAVLLAGFVRDGFMAIFMTKVIETEHVGPVYAGTATGFAMAISSIGNVLAPPIGNSLAGLWPGAPFVFWSMLSMLSFVCILFVKEARASQSEVVTDKAAA